MTRVTNAQYNAVLETIAKRLEEKKSITPEEAAKLVRESKTYEKEPSKK